MKPTKDLIKEPVKGSNAKTISAAQEVVKERVELTHLKAGGYAGTAK